ncbi:uncharacterized protein AB675_4935 [Cyphellophora attinorum]|uniref:Uncharacterized protein n=1 Tax=Cyphellophora attinorum TaxID=1664694 RepID=A0A0N0NHI6_9EURO|nr:uncharacterized protein AB675_4935 [Phialophora attinorum]KPI34608.1 hypothetical protein AB675_4935 [Phialophora attinorum]
MYTLDTVPSEIRLKIFEQFMQGAACTLVLYVQPPCPSHHRPASDTKDVVKKESNLLVVFHSKGQSLRVVKSLVFYKEAFHGNLLASNRKIRIEFLGYLGRDLHLVVAPASAKGTTFTGCDNCCPIDSFSGLVHEPLRGLVKTIAVGKFNGLVPLRAAIPHGFPTLRKVVLPPLRLGLDVIGVDLHAYASTSALTLPEIVVGPLKQARESRAAESLSNWLRRYELSQNKGNATVWEMHGIAGTVELLFGMKRPRYVRDYSEAIIGDLAEFSMKKQTDGVLSFSFELRDVFGEARRKGYEDPLQFYRIEY